VRNDTVVKPAPSLSGDLRGGARLAVDAVQGVTDVVEALHTEIARTPTALAGPVVSGLTRGIAQLAYASVRQVTRAVGHGIDAGLAALGPALGPAAVSRTRDAVIAAVNGVLGHHLAESGNPLALGMDFRVEGRALTLSREGLAAAIDAPSRRILVLVHGLCVDDLRWRRNDHDHGAALARDLGYSPVYLHYNTGLHISTNGRTLSEMMDALVGAWPVPVEEVAILAHSMGGLVARSAEDHARRAGLDWRTKLRVLVFIGTPHLGAPLEQLGRRVHELLGATPYSAPFARLGNLRSAGITDLRHGWVRDEDWHGRDRFARHPGPRHPLPLPRDVRCYAVAATLATRPRRSSRVIGDGLVPVSSALGRHHVARLSLAFPPSHRWIARGSSHFDLLSCPAVYAKIHTWLAGLRSHAASATSSPEA
jgi:hypothetical protein